MKIWKFELSTVWIIGIFFAFFILEGGGGGGGGGLVNDDVTLEEGSPNDYAWLRGEGESKIGQKLIMYYVNAP